MLYSTIEEAWSKSSVIEGFTRSEEDCCEKLISEIIKCDGCIDRLKKKLLGVNRPSIIDTLLRDTDPLHLGLLVTAFVLMIFILFG